MMRIDSDQATGAAPKLNNKEKPAAKKSSATKHETVSNQCQ